MSRSKDLRFFLSECNEVLLKMFLSCSQFNLFLYADVFNEVVPSSGLLSPFFSDGLRKLMGYYHFHVDCFALSICSDWSKKMDVFY